MKTRDASPALAPVVERWLAADRPLVVEQIAREAGCTGPTARAYLRELELLEPAETKERTVPPTIDQIEALTAEIRAANLAESKRLRNMGTPKTPRVVRIYKHPRKLA